jgi:nucleotide-binding universal stress UspA family protein
MTGPSTGDSGPSAPLDVEPTPFAATAVDVTQVIVPLDGSPFAERAVPVAGWVAAGLGAGVDLVEVVGGDEEGEGAIRYLDSVSRRYHAAGWDVVQRDDVADALAEAVAGSATRMACMATHGRDRSAGLLGSMAAAVVDRSDRPVILVGPEAHAVTAADAPIVVVVDGTARDDLLMPVALGWAARLGRRVEIAAVARPAAAGAGGGTPPRHAGGPAEPEGYLASLAARAAGAGATVTPRVADDPAGGRNGLAPPLDRTAALVVLASGQRRGDSPPGLANGTARIVHDAPVPALVVPLPDPASPMVGGH